MKHVLIAFLISIFLFNFSCSLGRKVEKSGTEIKNLYTYYLNHHRKFSFHIAGDHRIVHNKKELSKILKNFKLDFSSVRIIDVFKTNVDPELHSTIVMCESVSNWNSFLHKNDIIFSDKNLDFCFKDSMYFFKKFDSITGAYYCFISKKTDEKQESNHAFFIYEYNDKLISFTVGDKYSEISKPDCFGDAISYSTYLDGTLNYAGPLTNLLSNETYYKQDKWSFDQVLLTFGSRVSNFAQYKAALAGYNKSKTIHSEKNENIELENELKKIIEFSKNEKIVLFNENHFSQSHRYLLYLLLDDYYKSGFRYLALEAVWEDTKELENRGFPISSTGFYCQDPMYAHLIRKALKLGFKIISYDDFETPVKREFEQAKKIFSKTFRIDQNTKVLGLVGSQHIDKSIDSDKRWMASFLKHDFGIDPFTISQIHYWSAYNSLTLLTDSSKLANLVLVNSLSNFKLEKLNLLSETSVSFEIDKNLKYAKTVFAHVYFENEYANFNNAIPIQVTEILKSENELKLELPPGNYTFTLNTESKPACYKKNFQIH